MAFPQSRPLLLEKPQAGDMTGWPYSIIDYMSRLWNVAVTPYARLTLSVAGNANVTLKNDQMYHKILEFSGVLTGNINIFVPTNYYNTSEAFQWTVFNNTTGAFTLTVKTVAGAGILVAQGKRAILYCDGTNVVRVTPDT